MSWLLDTNTCSYVLRRQHGVRERLASCSVSEVYVSAVTVAEAHAGAHKSLRREQILGAWTALLKPFTSRIIPFDATVAETYGIVRATLETQGTMIGDRDCMIAATAMTHSLVLVTHNTREFARVEGLELEDWVQSP